MEKEKTSTDKDAVTEGLGIHEFMERECWEDGELMAPGDRDK